MSKHKKFGKVHISRMGYDLSKFYKAPRRKRERSLSEPRESKEKAALALEHQGGKADPMNHQ